MVLTLSESREGAPVSRKLNEEERALVHEALQRRLREVLGPGPHPAEEMLPDYILAMVDNRRSRDFVAHELNSLLAEEKGNLGDEIARWVWSHLGRLRDADAGTQDPLETDGLDEHSQRELGRSVQSSGSGAEKVKRSDDAKVGTTGTRASGSASSRTAPPRQSLSKSSNPSRRAQPAETRHSSSAQQEQESSEEEPKPRERTSSKRTPSKNSKTGRSLNAPDIASKRQRTEAESSEEHPSVGSAALGSAPASTASEYPVSREREATDAGAGLANEATTSNASTDLPQRCQFWPNCRHGNSCKFYHPTELCRFFPHCRAGERCRYIHPVGRAGAPAGMALMRTMMGLPPQSGIPIPCKYGYACERRRKDRSCPFAHPLVACRFGKECRKKALGACAFSHAPPCRHGWSCSRPGCTFAHPAQEPEAAHDDGGAPPTPGTEPVASPTSDADMYAEQTPMSVLET